MGFFFKLWKVFSILAFSPGRSRLRECGRRAWRLAVEKKARYNTSQRLPQVAQTAKNLPTMREMWIQSLGWEDALEKEMATHSSILAWRIPWTEEPGGPQSMGSQRVGHN